ncbi:exonuclease SbcC [Alloactinosynnema sp. L-07]|uniref:Clp protease N-terminal domain-containing protein n=1 Tax=Alloactinosynnema sp. L-07 TaxID=1653480 RepID=UPI00065EF542|nr:Clp protease N-terminal domain-containing protein [Alloactinosynnema sp. L-07]CRK59344.1 exonuclease SbcC [Alloactinosynnema sp. L-07]
MNAVRLAVLWVPALLASAALLAEVGPAPALAVAAVCLLGQRHWLVAALVVAVAVYFGDAPVLPLLLASLYRVVYADPIGSLIEPQTGGTRRARSRRHRCTPVAFCRHGARREYRLGDRAMWHGDPRTALDAYLRALAEHPADGLCARILELRAAEASQAVGAARLAAALGSAAVADLPESPIFRQAVVAARGHVVRALAACDLGDPAEGRRLLRLGQAVAHRDRPAERYVRLGAVAVLVSGQDAANEEQAQDVVSGALVGQAVKRVTPYELAWAVLVWADVLAGRGRRDLAVGMYRHAIGMIEGDELCLALARPSELEQARHAANVLVSAVCGLLETSSEVGADLAERGAAALDAASRTGDALAAARVCAARYARSGRAEARDAGDRWFDGSAAFFGDERLQDSWARVRAELARSAPGTPVSAAEPVPWSWHPEVAATQRQGAAAAVALLDAVARQVPAVGAVAAHARATAAAIAAGPTVTQLVVPLEALIVPAATDTPGTAEVAAVEAAAEVVGASGPADAGERAVVVDAVLTSEVVEALEADASPAADEDAGPVQVGSRRQPAARARRGAREVVRAALPEPPDWLAAAESLTEAHCETVHGAWSLAHAAGQPFVDVTQLLLAAAVDRECGAALAAAGATVERLGRALERVLGGGCSAPSGLTAGAEEVLRGALHIAREHRTVLIRPWHVLTAVLSGPPSVVTCVLAAEGVCVDEVVVRLSHGAANSMREPEPTPLGPATSAFGVPARAVFEEACRLAVRRGRLTGDEVVVAVSRYALAPPSLRGRASAGGEGPREHRRSARLDSALRELDAVSARWSRGVDLADLVTAAQRRPPWGLAHVPSAATTGVLVAAARHARLEGHAFVGKEHVLLGLDGPPREGLAFGVRPVFTPLVKRLLAVAGEQAGGADVEPAHLRSALAGGRPC